MQLMEIMKFIWQHPLNKGQKIRALSRFIRWQIGSRIIDKPVVFSWINGNVRQVVQRGMTAATGNIYVGLMEFEQMAFVLHYMRPHDVFFDIGANIGTYSLLAGKAVGANCLAFEPIPGTFASLMDNVFLNRVHNRITPLNLAIGKCTRELRFSTGLDTMNRVLTSTDTNLSSISVKVLPLDEACNGFSPEMIKIDVEGFESEVISGGISTFTSPALNVVLMELRGNGSRYGVDEHDLDEYMKSIGFKAHIYHPFQRTITAKPQNEHQLGDMLYIRDSQKAENRISTSPRYTVNNRLI